MADCVLNGLKQMKMQQTSLFDFDARTIPGQLHGSGGNWIKRKIGCFVRVVQMKREGLKRKKRKGVCRIWIVV